MCNLNLREVSYIKKFHDGGRRVPLTNLEIPFTRTWTLEGYDENNNLIAFLITMPSFSRALKKINGKIGLMGYFHLFKAQHFNDRVSLYLIGVDPKYQSKGVTAVIFNELQQTFNNRGIVEVETNPELVENKAIQAFWKNYESTLHKRRATFTKSL